MNRRDFLTLIGKATAAIAGGAGALALSTKTAPAKDVRDDWRDDVHDIEKTFCERPPRLTLENVQPESEIAVYAHEPDRTRLLCRYTVPEGHTNFCFEHPYAYYGGPETISVVVAHDDYEYMVIDRFQLAESHRIYIAQQADRVYG